MVVTFAEHRALALGKEAILPSVSSPTLDKLFFDECLSWTLDKVYVYFFLFPTKLFVVCSYTM
jgi:hypothetical protein